MSSDDEMIKLFWINQATQAHERASHQRILANHLINESIHQKNDIDLLNEIEELREHNAILQHDNKYYSRLLAKPMAEIAAENHKFKETYEKQMELLADWIVSQKAFKELAIQFGIEKGLTPTEVMQMGLNKKIDVLENRHDINHNTNVGDSVYIGPRVDKLKNKLKK